MARLTKAQAAEREEARERLRVLLKPGDTVHTVLRHESRSGMLRVVDLKHVGDDGSIEHIGCSAALAMGDTWDSQREGIKVTGCGMDMGFALVYNLGAVLWPEGFGCIGEGCPSNDHANGDRDYTPYKHPHIPHPDQLSGKPAPETSPRHWHRTGGYALRHRWL